MEQFSLPPSEGAPPAFEGEVLLGAAFASFDGDFGAEPFTFGDLVLVSGVLGVVGGFLVAELVLVGVLGSLASMVSLDLGLSVFFGVVADLVLVSESGLDFLASSDFLSL